MCLIFVTEIIFFCRVFLKSTNYGILLLDIFIKSLFWSGFTSGASVVAF